MAIPGLRTQPLTEETRPLGLKRGQHLLTAKTGTSTGADSGFFTD
jgi:hypothetical protein